MIRGSSALNNRIQKGNKTMKKYLDPTLEVIRFDIADKTNADNYAGEYGDGDIFPVDPGHDNSTILNKIWQEIHW